MRGKLRDESGALLIEVMVSAVLVGVLATGSLGLLDRAHGAGSSNRSRSVAAALAQQEQGRLRALDPVTLANVRSTQVRRVGGIDYTITSRADAIREASGEVTCSSDSSGVDYVKTSSSVTWPNMKLTKPIVSSSLAAPPAGGGAGRGVLTVKLQDAAGLPVSNIGVTAGGVSDLTNELGCAVFAQLAAGNTQVIINQSGWVTPDGSSSVNQTASVIAGQTAQVSLQYDRAATVPVTFTTRHPTTGAVTAATAAALSAAHPSLSGPRIFTPPSPAPSIAATPLFPFTNAYSLYAGSCAGNSPVLYNANYFSQNPGLVQTAPGTTAAGVAIRVPTITFTVRRYNSGASGATTAYNGASVVVRADTSVPAMAGCATRFSLPVDATTSVVTLAAPFGSYVLCASDGSFYGNATTASTSPNGVSATDPIIPRTGTQTGQCP